MTKFKLPQIKIMKYKYLKTIFLINPEVKIN